MAKDPNGAARQAALRARKKAAAKATLGAAATEVRGIMAVPEDHPEIRKAAARITGRRARAVRKAQKEQA